MLLSRALMMAVVTSGAWDLSASSYDGVSFSVNSQDTSPGGVSFKSDGTKMYVVGEDNDSIYQYSLSTAWDLSTASYDSVSFSVSAQVTNAYGIAFKDDGTKMYVINNTGTHAIYQYSLSTAWDLSTASYDNKSMFTDGAARDMFFKPDGSRIYILFSNNILEYSLSTAWDLSTSSFDDLYSANDQASEPYGLAFKDDGTKMFILGNTNASVYQYSFGTAWDLSTLSYDNVSFSVSSQDSSPVDIAFKLDDGTKMFILGYNAKSIYQYSL